MTSPTINFYAAQTDEQCPFLIKVKLYQGAGAITQGLLSHGRIKFVSIDKKAAERVAASMNGSMLRVAT